MRSRYSLSLAIETCVSRCQDGSRIHRLGKFIADETEKWAKVIRAANIKAE